MSHEREALVLLDSLTQLVFESLLRRVSWQVEEVEASVSDRQVLVVARRLNVDLQEGGRASGGEATPAGAKRRRELVPTLMALIP